MNMMRIITALKNFALLCVLLLLLYILIIPTAPYVVISAISEIVAYRVARTEVAAIPLISAHVRSNDASVLMQRDENGKPMLTGLLEPAANSIVHYRYLAGKISIVVDGGEKSAGAIRFPDGSTHELSHRAMFVVDSNQGTLQRLPIAGPAEIGQEYGVQGGPADKDALSRPIMSEGNIIVFGRGRVYPYRKDLYPVSGATFPLPSGGRLSSGDALIPNSVSDAKPWFGIAQIVPGGFKISATTISSNLRLYRMGSKESETFALSVLTQAVSDPVFQWIVFIFGVLQALISIWSNKNSRKKKTPSNDENNLGLFNKYFCRIFRLH